ncbi:MAG: acyltransferase [Burkholderiaceae bacterium]|nr:acyltransferase [Burkholderiaceae bacterium]
MAGRGAVAHDATASLDGLRGLAALMVVASHASGLGLNLVPGLSLAGMGKYGVYLFFVLSAYLLSAQWLQAWAQGQVSWSYLGHYLSKRVLRIYPLYALVLLIGLALAPRGLGVPLDAAAVWRHLTLQEGRDIYWSVPVEFLYYLCIPLLTGWLALRWPGGLRVLGVLLVLAVAHALFPAAATPINSSNLGFYLPVFVAGSLCAWWMHATAPRASTAPRLLGVLDMLALLALLCSAPAVYHAAGWARGPDALHRSFVAWGLFWGLILVGMLRGLLPYWVRVLQQSPWRACGRWCFGIYLLHMPALYAAKRLPLPETLRAWLGLALALTIAALAYRLIERPAVNLWRGRVPS